MQRERQPVVVELPCKAGLSQERLFAQLRSKGIAGKVQRMYFEPSGRFTILRAQKPAPGLPIQPGWDAEYIEEQQLVPDHFACCNCGLVVQARQMPDADCGRCGQKEWRQAVR